LKNNFRIGNGYDVHRLTEGRKLILGGIEIPSETGLLGHSDADVLLHSVCDALLGALALGDIGRHFPDNDPAYKNIDSKVLLQKVYELIDKEGYEINNIDSIIILESPKLSAYIPEMRKTIAGILNCDGEQISIKATTSEKIGFVGREEGAAAFSTVLLIQKEI
jgi:2-C-methyl-D-erythritol 2,4-cyclodiphosphate synthase